MLGSQSSITGASAAIGIIDSFLTKQRQRLKDAGHINIDVTVIIRGDGLSSFIVGSTIGPNWGRTVYQAPCASVQEVVEQIDVLVRAAPPQ